MAKAKFDRTQVIEAATELFWQKGYRLSSMQDVVQATGLQPGSLYHSFGNKAGLFEQALIHYAEQTRQRIEAELAQAASAPAGICQILKHMVDESAAADYCSCFLVKSQLELSSQSEEALSTLIAQQLKEIEALYTQALTAEFGAQRAAILAGSVMLHIFGIRVYGYLGSPSKPLLAAIESGLPWLPWHAVH